MQFQNLSKLFRSSVGLTTFNKAQPTVIDSLVPYLGIGGVRHKRGKLLTKPIKDDPEGIKHHGFSYFPRHPDEQDPPYEPTKLFAITRTRSLKNRPYWEKHVVKIHLKLSHRGEVAIVKNSPNTNAMLYKVKHLINIQPITFPYGFPEDINQGYLDEHGKFTTYNLLPTDPEKAQEENNKLRQIDVDGPTLKQQLRNKWFTRWS